jgi:hypothetical protein
MSFVKRILATIGAVALLGTMLLAGTASAAPTSTTSTTRLPPYFVEFTATVVTGPTTATLVSTHCVLFFEGSETPHRCSLVGTLTASPSTEGGTWYLTLTGSGFPPVQMTLGEVFSGPESCSTGPAVILAPSGRISTFASMGFNITQIGANRFRVSGEIEIGNNAFLCGYFDGWCCT